jgi:hypothetical protein
LPRVDQVFELHRGEDAHDLRITFRASLRTSSGKATFWNTFMCGQIA